MFDHKIDWNKLKQCVRERIKDIMGDKYVIGKALLNKQKLDNALIKKNIELPEALYKYMTEICEYVVTKKDKIIYKMKLRHIPNKKNKKRVNHNSSLDKSVDRIIVKPINMEEEGTFRSFMELYNTDGNGLWLIYLGDGELYGSMWYYGMNNLGEYIIKRHYDTFGEFVCKEVCPECVIEDEK